MRYLTTYKLFENSKAEITQSCEDILLDLDDGDYTTSILYFNEDKIHIIVDNKGLLSNKDKLFKYSEISDVVERLTSYLDTEGYYQNGVYFMYGDDRYSYSRVSKINKDREYKSYKIEYLKK